MEKKNKNLRDRIENDCVEIFVLRTSYLAKRYGKFSTNIIRIKMLETRNISIFVIQKKTSSRTSYVYVCMRMPHNLFSMIC